MPVEITRAGPNRLPALASVLGRSFVTEPMLLWSLGDHGDVARRFVQDFEYFLEGLMELGVVWEAGDALGAAVWVPPEQAEAWADAQLRDERVYALTEDGGRRYDSFWAWVDSKLPAEPTWRLDSVGVDPAWQGRGIGRALVAHGLTRADAAGFAATLETGSPRNVAIYEHLGFRVVEEAAAPDGGPLVWFMRHDPPDD